MQGRGRRSDYSGLTGLEEGGEENSVVPGDARAGKKNLGGRMDP